MKKIEFELEKLNEMKKKKKNEPHFGSESAS